MQKPRHRRVILCAEVDEMYTYYRMTGSKKLLTMYRCEHCGRVAFHPLTIKQQTTYNSTWTSAGLERRRARKEEELTQRMDKAAASMAEGAGPMAFLGKEIDGKCPHCSKKQSWMRMCYRLWGSFVGIMAMMTGFGLFSIATFEGRRAQLQTIQAVTGAAAVFTVLLALGLVVHAAVMITRTRRNTRENPVIVARSAEELLAHATQHPAYMAEWQKQA